MTKYEFYQAIISKSAITDEMVEIAQAGIKSLENRKANSSKKIAEKKLADKPMLDSIYAFLEGKEQVLASDIVKGCGISSTSKVVSLLKDRPEIKCEKIHIKGVGERNAYTLVKAE